MKKMKIDVSGRSTRFSYVHYDGVKLAVKFKSGGKLVTYSGVSQATFEEFIGAKSMGRYYDDQIRGRYTRKGVDDTPLPDDRDDD